MKTKRKRESMFRAIEKKSEDFYFKTFLKSGILSELDDKTKSNKNFALAHVHTRQIEVIFRLF